MQVPMHRRCSKMQKICSSQLQTAGQLKAVHPRPGEGVPPPPMKLCAVADGNAEECSRRATNCRRTASRRCRKRESWKPSESGRKLLPHRMYTPRFYLRRKYIPLRRMSIVPTRIGAAFWKWRRHHESGAWQHARQSFL